MQFISVFAVRDCFFVLNSKDFFKMLPETSEKLDKILLPKAFHADFFFFPIYIWSIQIPTNVHL